MDSTSRKTRHIPRQSGAGARIVTIGRTGKRRGRTTAAKAALHPWALRLWYSRNGFRSGGVR